MNTEAHPCTCLHDTYTPLFEACVPAQIGLVSALIRVVVRGYPIIQVKISLLSEEQSLCIAPIFISQYSSNNFLEKVFLQIHEGVRHFFGCIIKVLCVELIVQKWEPTTSIFKGGTDFI